MSRLLNPTVLTTLSTLVITLGVSWLVFILGARMVRYRERRRLAAFDEEMPWEEMLDLVTKCQRESQGVSGTVVPGNVSPDVAAGKELSANELTRLLAQMRLG